MTAAWIILGAALGIVLMRWAHRQDVAYCRDLEDENDELRVRLRRKSFTVVGSDVPIHDGLVLDRLDEVSETWGPA